MQNKTSLTAYRITCDDGFVWETSMAADVTLKQAQDYYIGKPFEKEDGGTHTPVKVEQI